MQIIGKDFFTLMGWKFCDQMSKFTSLTRLEVTLIHSPSPLIGDNHRWMTFYEHKIALKFSCHLKFMGELATMI